MLTLQAEHRGALRIAEANLAAEPVPVYPLARPSDEPEVSGELGAIAP